MWYKSKWLLLNIIAVALAIIGYFFSNNMRGNAIADLLVKTTFFIGADLFVMGLIGHFSILEIMGTLTFKEWSKYLTAKISSFFRTKESAI